MKKFLSIFLSIVIAFSMFSCLDFKAFAEDTIYTSGDWSYRILNDGTAEIYKDSWEAAYSGNATSVIIPSQINGYTVTRIGEFAFSDCTSLTSVTIGDGITSISERAFSYCASLTSISVNSGNRNYSSENGVLFNKDKTRLLCYPVGKANNTYAIPNSVTKIGNWAFYGCTSLTSITISNSVISIGDYTFFNCTSLTSVTIPYGVTSIGDSAFWDCTSLASITIPDSVTSIENTAFWDCTSLASITIPDSVTSMGYGVFCGCTSLTNVTIGNNVTSIGICTFSGCTSLTSIAIPNSVIRIETEAFDNCNNLEAVYYSGSATDWSNIPISSSNTCLTNAEIHYNYYQYNTLDKPLNVSINNAGEYKYILYTPSESGIYKFYSTGSVDTYGYIYDNNMNQLAKDDDSGSGNNFSISYKMNKNTSYTLAARLYSSSNTGNFSVYVTQLTHIYEVDFNANSGTCSTDSIEVTLNEEYGELPTPTREGYNFDGWYTSSSGGSKVTSSTTVSTASNHTLYAHWTANNYTVSFNANGGSCSTTSKSVAYDNTYGTLPTPTKAGYNFDGWYTSSSGGSKVTSSTTVSTASNHTLYAHWSIGDNILLNDSTDVTIGYGGEYKYFCFTPSESGIYKFYSTGDIDTYGYIYDSNMNELSRDDDSGNVNNFSISYKMNKNTSYILAARLYSSSNTGNFSVCITQLTHIYEVDFNANAGICSADSIEVTLNEAYGELPTPTKEGYVFDGWYTSSSGGSQVTSSTIVSTASDHTLYAHWSADNYTVSFNANGGSCSTNSKSVTYDSTYGTLPTPTKAGYNFDGWYTSSSGGSQVTSSTKVSTASDHTLYAHWTADNYTVSFNAIGGSCSTSSKSVTYDSTYGTLPTPTRTGYSFDGWYTSSSGGSKVTSSTKVSTASDHTLYAHWTADNYTVSFNANGGSCSTNSKSVAYDSTYGTLPTPTRTGYSFDGWYTSATGGSTVTSSTKVSTTSNHTLYAHWSAKDFYVDFDANGGYCSTNYKSVTFDSTYGTLPSPTRTGYSFDGWYTKKSGGSKITSTTYVTTDGDHTLYAHWTANSYTITYYNGFEKVGTSTHTYGTSKRLTTAYELGMSKPGYTFSGWNTTYYLTYVEYSNGQSVSDLTSVNNDNINLYAVWSVNDYVVSFNANGGYCSTNSKTVTFDSAYNTLPTPTRTGYSFDGWYTSANGGSNITENTSVTIDSDHTLYAHWTANTYYIDFDTNGGHCSTASKSVTYDSSYGNLPVPTREGYKFDGWYCYGEEVTSDTIVSNDYDHTLYAHWTALPKTAEIIEEPYQTLYYIGDKISLDGIQVKITYYDDSTEFVTADQLSFTCDTSTAGKNKDLVVSYTENGETVTATTKITVKKPSARSYCDGLETDEIYLVGSGRFTLETTPSGLPARWESSDEGIIYITSDGYYRVTGRGETKITAYFEYNGITYEKDVLINVTGTAKSVTNVQPAQDSYYVGEEFNNKVSFHAVIDDGFGNISEVDVVDHRGPDGDTSTPGKKTVTFDYFGVTVSYTYTVKQPGDVNGDGKLTVVDAKWILQSVANTRKFSSEQKTAADVNGDGKVTVVDAKWILQAIAGMRDLSKK